MKKETLFVNVVANIIIIMVVSTLVVSTIMLDKQTSPVTETTAIYNGDKTKPYVSIMFNVYEGENIIPDILKVLKKYNVQTTFFIGGCFASKHNGLIRQIVDNGHEIGNHGYLHKLSSALTYQQIKDEITLTNDLLTKLTDQKMTLFAPPSGDTSETMYNCCNELGMTVILWSKDTIDWRDKDESIIYKRATTNINNGDFILMHPTLQTLKALPKILDYYNQNNIYVNKVGSMI